MYPTFNTSMKNQPLKGKQVFFYEVPFSRTKILSPHYNDGGGVVSTYLVFLIIIHLIIIQREVSVILTVVHGSHYRQHLTEQITT